MKGNFWLFTRGSRDFVVLLINAQVRPASSTRYKPSKRVVKHHLTAIYHFTIGIQSSNPNTN